MMRRSALALWRGATKVFGCAAVAAALLAAQPAWAYVGCVFTSTDCSFEASCHEYDDTTHEDLGVIFHLEFYTC